jgi:radical SAM/Cys-rich protein
MKPFEETEATKNNERYDFQAMLKEHGITISPVCIETLWVNITRLCNQTCVHCHVGASPNRKEEMNRSTVDRCLEIIAGWDSCRNIDITGGAPELNKNFDYLVTEARKLNKHVIVRTNITVIFDGNSQTDEKKMYLPEFFAQNQVEILASLPHYLQNATDQIRGAGAFDKSIEGLRLLNARGYGKDGGGLILNLVNNWDGPITPGEQAGLEEKFKREFICNYGIVFNKLFTVTNMPVNRYRLQLQRLGTYHKYMRALVGAFSPAAAERVVCRSLINVGYDGRIYDCDFNQMLNLQIANQKPANIFDVDFDTLVNRKIKFGSHCFGCTAGGGSS